MSRKIDANWECFNGVEYFFAMSDGVSAQNLGKVLQQIDVDVVSATVNEIRRQLLMRGDLSYDDQAVIIGRLMADEGEIASESHIA